MTFFRCAVASLLVASIFVALVAIFRTMDPLEPLARHVVHIAIDGLRPDCLFIGQQKPRNIIHRIAEKGSATLEHCLTSPITISAPSWTYQLCSMDPSRTGILDNSWVPPWYPFYSTQNAVSTIVDSGGYLPTVFRVMKQWNSNARTALFYDWAWFKYLGKQSIPGSVDYEFHSERIKNETGVDHTLAVATNASNYLRRIMRDSDIRKSYTFVYFEEVDVTGHGHGWCSEPYLEAISRVDDAVGLVLDSIDLAKTLIVLSSDHGGLGNGHGTVCDHTLRIPMMLSGPGVKKNYIIQNWIDGRDLAPTIFHIIGLNPSPMWQGRVIREILTF